VRTDDGRVLECDFVVVGIGAQPRTRLAAEAGIAVDDGVLVDERLETSVPGVFAAGDARRGSGKRVAAAVGEGSATVSMVHEYLETV
jgi:thioredoxin reductase